MLFEHASFGFHSWLLILLEVVLVALAAGLLLIFPSTLQRVLRPFNDCLRAMADRPRVAILGVALCAVVLQAATTWIFGPPVPRVVDEFAYLLAADTYASGRLTNPSLEPVSAFFCPQVVSQPTRQSKYPPMQSLLLGTGQALGGHPVVGLWLSAALLTAAAGWCALAFVETRWALVAAILILLRLAVGSYWAQSYWGGHAAAIGGLLLLGGCGRLLGDGKRSVDVVRDGRRRLTGAVGVAVGGCVLLGSRPFEGLMVILAVGIVALLILLKDRPSSTGGWDSKRTWRVVRALPAGLATGLAGVWLLVLLGHAVTGSWRQLPHLVYSHQFKDRGHFVWNSLGSIDQWPELAAIDALRKVPLAVFFQLGIGLLLCVLLLPTLRSRSLVFRNPGFWLSASAAAAVLVAHVVVRPFHTHYTAPATGAFLMLAVFSLRALETTSSRGVRLSMAPALLLISVYACLFVVQLPAHRPEADSDAAQRLTLERALEAEGGRHLMVSDFDGFWACNGADAEESPVLWARARSAADAAAVVEAWPDRKPWRAVRGRDGRVRYEVYGTNARR